MLLLRLAGSAAGLGYAAFFKHPDWLVVSAQESSSQQLHLQASSRQQSSVSEAATAATAAQPDTLTSASGSEVPSARPVHRPTRSMAPSADPSGMPFCPLLSSVYLSSRNNLHGSSHHDLT